MTAVVEIVKRLRDERCLFFLAVVVVIGTLSFFSANATLTWVVVLASLLLILLFSTFDYLRDRRGAGRTAIALRFPDGVDQTSLSLQSCDFEVSDPRDPEAKRPGKVRPYQAGDGWLGLAARIHRVSAL
jgi:hypothetical protein